MKRKLLLLLVFSAFLLCAAPKLSPWDAWRMAYTTFEQGEEFRDKGNYVEALKAFQNAKKYYQTVQEARPDWNQKVIEERLADCDRECGRMRGFLGSAAAKAASEKKSAKPGISEQRALNEVDALQKKLAAAEVELADAKKKLEAQNGYEQEISNLMRDQRTITEKYNMLERRYRLLERKAAQPDRKAEELQNQLVAERMKSDLASKQLQASELRRTEAENARRRLNQEKLSADNERRRAESELDSAKKQLESAEIAAKKSIKQIAESAEREKMLNQRLAQDGKELARLRKEIEEWQNQYRKKLETGGVNEGKANLLKTNQKLTEELNALRTSLRSLQQEQQKLQNEAEKLRTARSEALSTAQKAEAEQKTLRQSNAELKQNLVRLQADSRLAGIDLENLKQACSRSETQLKNAVKENEELKKRLAFREGEDFKKLTAAGAERKKLMEEQKKSEAEIANLRAEKQGSAERIAALERSNQDLVTENRRLRTEFSKQQKELRSYSGTRSDITVLTKQHEELKRNFAALQAENRQNKLAVEAAKPREAELSRIKLRLTELDDLKRRFAREQSFNEQLNAEKRRLEREVAELKPLSNENKQLRAEQSTWKNQQSELTRLRKLNTDLAAAKALEPQLAEMKVELAKLTPLAADAEKLRKRNAELEQGKVLLENGLSQLKTQIAEMQKIGVQNEELNKKLASLQKIQQNNEELKLRLQESQEKLEHLEKSQSELAQKSSVLVQDLAKVTGQQRTSERKLKEKDFSIRELEKKTAQLTAERENLKRELESAALRNSELKLARSAVEKELKELKRFTAFYKQIDAQETPKLAAMQDALREFSRNTEELLALRGEREAMKEQVKRAEQTAASLQKRLDQLSKAKAVSDREAALLRESNEKNMETEEQLTSIRSAAVKQRSELELLRPLKAELAQSRAGLTKLRQELQAQKEKYAILQKTADELLSLRSESESLRKLNKDLAERRLKAESELSSLKNALADNTRLNAEVLRLRKLSAELAGAKLLEGELAQAKLRIARLEQSRDELTRQRALNEELTRDKKKLEEELALRPKLPSFAPENYSYESIKNAGKPIGKAIDYIAAGKVAEHDDKEALAVWNYRTALKLEPQNMEAVELLGMALLRRGDFQEAAPLLSIARNARPESIDLALNTANAYIAIKRFGNAAAIVEPLLKRNPENPRLQIAAALAASGSGSHARAAGLLRLAAVRLPQDPTPRIELARLLVNSDASRLHEAVKLYEQARQLGAEPDPELEPKLGALLNRRRTMNEFLNSAAAEAASKEQWSSAIWYYRQLIDLDRDSEHYRVRLAYAQFRKGSGAAALETLSLESNSALGALTEALIRYRRKEIPEALQAARRARMLNHGKPVKIPVDWSVFALDFARLTDSDAAKVIHDAGE